MTRSRKWGFSEIANDSCNISNTTVLRSKTSINITSENNTKNFNMVSSDGNIQITIDRDTTLYRGNSASINNTKLSIDGQEVSISGTNLLSKFNGLFGNANIQIEVGSTNNNQEASTSTEQRISP